MGQNFDLDVREENRVKYCWEGQKEEKSRLMSFMQIKLTPDY